MTDKAEGDLRSHSLADRLAAAHERWADQTPQWAQPERELSDLITAACEALITGTAQAPSASAVPAADQMGAAAPRAVLTELLRLYDWRFVLAARENDVRNDDEKDFRAETSRLLRQYGAEKKAAWEAARLALASEEPTAGPPAVPALPSGARDRQPDRQESQDPPLEKIGKPRAADAASPSGPRCIKTWHVNPTEGAVRCEWPVWHAGPCSWDAVRLGFLGAISEASAAAEAAAYARGLADAARIANDVLNEQTEAWEASGGEEGTPAWIDKIPNDEWIRQAHRYAGSGGADAAEEIANRIRALSGEPGAAAPPSSASGALAGAEDLTPKEKT